MRKKISLSQKMHVRQRNPSAGKQKTGAFRLLSMALTLCMVLTMMPAFSQPVQAADAPYEGEIEVHEIYSWPGFLGLYLSRPEPIRLILNDDITLEVEFSGDDYEKKGNYYEGYVEGVLNFDQWQVEGYKEIDLNGHNIYVWVKDALYKDHYLCPVTFSMFAVNDGATLVMNGEGEVDIDAHIYNANEDYSWNTWGIRKYVTNIDTNDQHNSPMAGRRDIFHVKDGGTLIINGGDYYAGDGEEQWIWRGVDGNGDTFAGHAEAIAQGSVVTINLAGACYINGGYLSGVATLTDSSRGVIHKNGAGNGLGKLVINGGTIEARCYANVLSFSSTEARENVFINGGLFKTKKVKAYTGERDTWDVWHQLWPVVINLCGYINIPSEAINPAATIIYDGREVTRDELRDLGSYKRTVKVLPPGPTVNGIDAPDVVYRGTGTPVFFTTTGDVSRYFTDLGPGQQSTLHYLWMSDYNDMHKIEQLDPIPQNNPEWIHWTYGGSDARPVGTFTWYLSAAESLTGDEDDMVSHGSIAVAHIQIREGSEPPPDIAQNNAQGDYYFTQGESGEYGQEAYYNLHPAQSGAVWSVAPGSDPLPAGVRISQQGAVENGMRYSAARLVYDGDGPTAEATVTLRMTRDIGHADAEINIHIWGAPTITTASLYNVLSGWEYGGPHVPFVTLAGTAPDNHPVVWFAAGLPSGLTLNDAGQIVGTNYDSFSQNYQPAIQITDTVTGLSSHKTFSIKTRVKPILDPLEIYARPGENINERIGRNVVIDHWAVIDGALPDGLELDSDGHIKGTAAVEGEWTVGVAAYDTDDYSGSTYVEIKVADQPRITNDLLEYLFELYAFENVEFQYQMTAEPSGGTWEIVTGGGTVNAGWLSIDPDTGLLSGTPSAADVTANSGLTKAEVNYNRGGQDAMLKASVYIRLYTGNVAPTDIEIDDIGQIKAGAWIAIEVDENGQPPGTVTVTNHGPGLASNEVLPGLFLQYIVSGEKHWLIGTVPEEAAGQTYTFDLTSTNSAGRYTETFTVDLKLAAQFPAPTLSIPGGPLDGATLVTLAAEAPDTNALLIIDYYINDEKHSRTSGTPGADLSADLTVNPGDVVTAKVSGFGNEFYRDSEVAAWVFTARDGSLPVPEILTDSLPGGKVGAAYSAYAEGNNGMIKWSASGLPAGLSINANTGLISGTPAASGSYSVTLSATNAGGAATPKTVTLTVSEGMAITTTALAEGSVGQTYSENLASNPSGAAWTALSKLPGGLTLSTSGVISGTPTEAGSSRVIVQAAAGSDIDSKTFLLIIHEVPEIETEELADGGVGAVYGDILETVSGEEEEEWSITAGSLPPGLTLDGATGEISGTPTAAGSSTFTVKVETEYGEATKQFTIDIQANVVTKIEIVTPPTKTAYREGDIFNPAGMKVEAVWSNGDRTDITSQISYYTGELAPELTAIQVSYLDTALGTGHAASTPITVTAVTSTVTPTQAAVSGDGNMEDAFRVLFESNGGSSVSPVTGLSYGDRITAPAAPVRDGYTFGGWYRDEACTIAWMFAGDAVPGDMTLYAKWVVGGVTPTVTAAETGTSAGPTTTTWTPTATMTATATESPTAAQTPAPVFGVLAGLGVVGVMIRRRLL